MTSVHTTSGAHPASYLLLFTEYWEFLPNDEVATAMSTGRFLPQDEVAADMSTRGSYPRIKWPLT